MDGLYLEEWYNEGKNVPENFTCPWHDAPHKKGPCSIPFNERLIMHSNRLLGVPQLRQLRVTNSSCSVPTNFKEVIKVCYDSYSSGIEDESPFGQDYVEYSSPDA